MRPFALVLLAAAVALAVAPIGAQLLTESLTFQWTAACPNAPSASADSAQLLIQVGADLNVFYAYSPVVPLNGSQQSTTFGNLLPNTVFTATVYCGNLNGDGDADAESATTTLSGLLDGAGDIFVGATQQLRTAAVAGVPTTFSVTTNINSQCATEILDQGGCGSCYAVSSAGVVTDRLCVSGSPITDSVTGNAGMVSPWSILGCSNAGQKAQCNGGQPGSVLLDLQQTPMYTCDVGTNCCEGVAPSTSGYLQDGVAAISSFCPNAPSDGSDTQCAPGTCQPPATCSGPSVAPTALPVTSCQFFLGFPRTALPLHTGYPGEQEMVQDSVRIQQEILKNGPVVSEIADPNQALINYYGSPLGSPINPPTSTFTAILSSSVLLSHAIRIVGWGEDANFVPYWMVANSWTTHFADNGYMRIPRGFNFIGIETAVVFPLVNGQTSANPSSSVDCSEQPVIANAAGSWFPEDSTHPRIQSLLQSAVSAVQPSGKTLTLSTDMPATVHTQIVNGYHHNVTFTTRDAEGTAYQHVVFMHTSSITGQLDTSKTSFRTTTMTSSSSSRAKWVVPIIATAASVGTISLGFAAFMLIRVARRRRAERSAEDEVELESQQA